MQSGTGDGGEGDNSYLRMDIHCTCMRVRALRALRVFQVLQHDFWGTHLQPPEGYNTHKSFRPVITLLWAAEWRLTNALGLGGREMQVPSHALRQPGSV